MAPTSPTRARRNPVVVAFVTLAIVSVVAFLGVAAYKVVPGLLGGEAKPGEGAERPLTAPGFDEPLAHIVLPKGWAGATNEETSDFDVRSPNDALHSTAVIVRTSYDQAFQQYKAQHEPTSITRWEMLESGLPLVHADFGDCVYSVVQASFDVSVTINSCVTEGHSIDDYRPAIGQLLEGVRP